jgi:phage-related protein
VVGFFTSMGEDIGSIIGRVVGFFEALPGRILGALAGAGTWLLDIGKQIVEGLIKGIEGMVGNVANAVKGIGSSVVNAAKGILGIFSPSTVFATIGSQVGAGLSLGITGSKEIVNSATNTLVSGVTQTAAQGLSHLPSPSTSQVPAAGSSVNITMNGVVTGQDLVNLLVKYCQQHGSLPSAVKIRGATS